MIQVPTSVQDEIDACVAEIEQADYHPIVEEVTDALQAKLSNTGRHFFRLFVSHYLVTMATQMRASVQQQGKGNLPMPCNMFTVNLQRSGAGKGVSMNTLEMEVLKPFTKEFTQKFLPENSQNNIAYLAEQISANSIQTPEEVLLRLEKEYAEGGTYLTSFDSATVPAIKQFSHLLKLAGAGSLNMIVDECGSNITRAEVYDALVAYLEIFDVGRLKEKLIKNSSENKRFTSLDSPTPGNLLMFGTPKSLFTGGREENAFYDLLKAGYARRSFFGFVDEESLQKVTPEILTQSAQDIFIKRVQMDMKNTLTTFSGKFEKLASKDHLGLVLCLNQPEAELLIQYEQWCILRSLEFNEQQELQKFEMEHKPSKVLKLAGAYSFVDGETQFISRTALLSAIKLAEDSSLEFAEMLNQPQPFERIADFIIRHEGSVTLPDLCNHFGFFNSASKAKKDEIMNLATAYALGKHCILRHSVAHNVDRYSGEELQETDLEQIIYTGSEDIARDYRVPSVEANKNFFGGFLHNFLKNTQVTLNWCNHAFEEEHRKKVNTIPGFNVIVLDVDAGTSLETAQMMLEEFYYIIYTTKRHSETEHRFRIILPTDFKLMLSPDEYSEMMQNIINDLPFNTDSQTKDSSRKWLANPHGEFFINNQDGLNKFPVLNYLPNSSTRQEYLQSQKGFKDSSNLEKWFLKKTAEGNRSNQLIRYGLLLLDQGNFTLEEAKKKVLALNGKMSSPLSEDEITSTIFITMENQAEDEL